MLRNWLLWSMLLAVTVGVAAGCGCTPEGGRPGSGGVTEEGKK